MSILFPKINKPRQWDYRPIYYDEEKYERKKRLEAMKQQAQREIEEETARNDAAQEQPYHTTLHRGSFREARDNNSTRVEEGKKANRRFVIILFILIVIAAIYFIL